jgi:hypothetical protein
MGSYYAAGGRAGRCITHDNLAWMFSDGSAICTHCLIVEMGSSGCVVEPMPEAWLLTAEDVSAAAPPASLADVLSKIPLVHLTGSENWENGYEWGGELDKRFPDNDGYDFAQACQYNGHGPISDNRITNLVMVEQGERDGAKWVWNVTLSDGSTHVATGGCDYTGWDCQSWLSWHDDDDD